MAIKIERTDGKLTIELDNGHVEAVDKIVKDYSLLGEKEAFGFMLATLSQANGGRIETPSGTYVPSESIKKPKEDAAEV